MRGIDRFNDLTLNRKVTLEPRIDLVTSRIPELLDALDQGRAELDRLDVPPMLAAWLRRGSEARGAHMSTRIEGNPMTEQQVREAFAHPNVSASEAEIENLNYRDAVRFARQVAGDPGSIVEVDHGLLRALHFLIVREVDRYGTAGQYRTQQNAVMHNRAVLYTPPPPGDCYRLVDGLLSWLPSTQRALHPVVVAAIAHAELINIHPFDDGNGRTTRALTTLLMHRTGWAFRGFVSIEQAFGADTEAYYAALRAFGDRYPGARTDFTMWVEWFLSRLVAEVAAEAGIAGSWLQAVYDMFRGAGIDERLAQGLGYVWLMRSIASADYADAIGVSGPTAVADLRRLIDMGFLERVGRGRATRYVSRQAPLDETVRDARRRALDALREIDRA